VVRKTYFLRHLYIKTIILPRQARDKHRETTQKRTFFSGECILSSPLILSFDPTNATGKKEKRLLFLSHLYIKCIILPRQARDKHRESTQKRTTCTVFLIAIDSVWPIITNTEV
jgi:hypothetical protein